jgi:signal transduction histidine kinase
MHTVAPEMESKLAQCRVILSTIAIAAVYIDPTEPTLPWLHLVGGAFTIDPYALGVMSAHLLYSLALYFRLPHRVIPPQRLGTLTIWADVLFSAAIVIFTEGTSSPFWPFFVFAVLAASAQGGYRRSLAVTTVSVSIYLSLILFAWHGETNFYIMRPVHLALVGYIAAYLGQQRLNLEAEVLRLEAVKQRNRIARALHDGCVQTLGGINLTLESYKALLQAGRVEDVITGLSGLQANVNHEHDELRAYVRELADVEATPVLRNDDADTRFFVSADFAGSYALLDQVLQIVREAATNVKRHARARSATVSIRAADSHVSIAIDDDGIGFGERDQIPWSMASRVTDAGGIIRVAAEDQPGAHLRLALPST